MALPPRRHGYAIAQNRNPKLAFNDRPAFHLAHEKKPGQNQPGFCLPSTLTAKGKLHEAYHPLPA
jgi:hypothetical protein